jgi:hypothetical protein
MVLRVPSDESLTGSASRSSAVRRADSVYFTGCRDRRVQIDCHAATQSVSDAQVVDFSPSNSDEKQLVDAGKYGDLTNTSTGTKDRAGGALRAATAIS